MGATDLSSVSLRYLFLPWLFLTSVVSWINQLTSTWPRSIYQWVIISWVIDKITMIRLPMQRFYSVVKLINVSCINIACSSEFFLTGIYMWTGSLDISVLVTQKYWWENVSIIFSSICLIFYHYQSKHPCCLYDTLLKTPCKILNKC